MNQFTYFILDYERGLVKIGHSRRPDERLQELQREREKSLSLLGVVPIGKNLEKHLHDKFRLHRHSGEWFIYSHEIVDYVKSPRVLKGASIPEFTKTYGTISARIKKASIAKLEKLAQEREITFTQLLREIIADFLKHSVEPKS